MANDDSQERTEEATEKRRRESKEKGSVARSKDLSSTVLLVGGISCFIMFSSFIGNKALSIAVKPFELAKQSDQITSDLMFNALIHAFVDAIWLVLPFLVMVVVVSLIGGILVGGWVFSAKNFMPKLERLDPIKGLQKIFSIKSMVELVKSILKFFLVFGFSIVVFSLYSDSLLALNFVDVKSAIMNGLWILLISVFAVCCSLIIISGIDVPFQIWQHTKELKMTKQELKDEMKETEGSPEVKARIAKMQREQARRRMMEKIPEADVVITNPDHFAVALKYDENNMSAPILVAKGTDLIAEKIKLVAEKHNVPIVSMPPLARSIFYFTELDDEIPGDLYVAVAQVLAYVYQLDLYRRGKMKRPAVPQDVPIPENMKR